MSFYDSSGTSTVTTTSREASSRLFRETRRTELQVQQRQAGFFLSLIFNHTRLPCYTRPRWTPNGSSQDYALGLCHSGATRPHTSTCGTRPGRPLHILKANRLARSCVCWVYNVSGEATIPTCWAQTRWVIGPWKKKRASGSPKERELSDSIHT